MFTWTLSPAQILGFKLTRGNEFILNLHSISLSVVDDENAIEVRYLSLVRYVAMGT